jgi:hypothetical protein
LVYNIGGTGIITKRVLGVKGRRKDKISTTKNEEENEKRGKRLVD